MYQILQEKLERPPTIRRFKTRHLRPVLPEYEDPVLFMITLKVIVQMHCTLYSSVIFFQTYSWNVRLLGAFVSSARNWSWILYLDHCYSILLFVLTHRQNVFEITDFFTLWIMMAFNWFYCGMVVWALPGIGKWLTSPKNVIVYVSISNWWGNIVTLEDETMLSWNIVTLEDETMLSWNIGHQLSSAMETHRRRTETSTTPLWKCNNSHDFAPWIIM
jgi:hypothetical protein